jgi:hypothetical protein
MLSISELGIWPYPAGCSEAVAMLLERVEPDLQSWTEPEHRGTPPGRSVATVSVEAAS